MIHFCKKNATMLVRNQYYYKQSYITNHQNSETRTHTHTHILTFSLLPLMIILVTSSAPASLSTMWRYCRVIQESTYYEVQSMTKAVSFQHNYIGFQNFFAFNHSQSFWTLTLHCKVSTNNY